MSRKWKRMVSKNVKTVNEYRLKQGIPPISDPDRPQVYKGRSILLSLFFVGISLLFIVAFTGAGQDNMYWFTMFSYLLLGLYTYFLRRPYLKVSKTSLSKRGFTGERIIAAEHIKQIIIKPGYVIIEPDGKQRWVYSKSLNRFDVSAIAGKLKSFSEQNHVVFVDETLK